MNNQHEPAERTVWKTVFGNPWVQALAALVGLLLTGFMAYALSFVLIPLLLAFLVAYILDPVVDWFERRGLSRTVTIGCIALLGLGVLASIPVIAIPSLMSQADNLRRAAVLAAQQPEEVDSFIERVVDRTLNFLPLEEFVQYTGLREAYESRADPFDDIFEHEPSELDEGEVAEEADNAALEPLPDGDEAAIEDDLESEAEAPRAARLDRVPAQAILADYIARSVRDNLRQFVMAHRLEITETGQRAGTTIASFFASLGRGTVSTIVFLGNLALFGFVAGYLLKDYDRVVAEMRNLVPPRWRTKVFQVFGDIDKQLRGFLIGQMTVCTFLATMYAIGMLISGVPFAILIALWGGLASLIPFFGVLLTFIPAATLTLIQYGFDWHILGVIITFVVVQGVESNIVTPQIMGNRVGLHPVWVILAVMVFGSLLGFTGLLIAVPLSAVLKVLVVEGVNYYKASPVFATAEGPPMPHSTPAPETAPPPKTRAKARRRKRGTKSGEG